MAKDAVPKSWQLAVADGRWDSRFPDGPEPVDPPDPDPPPTPADGFTPQAGFSVSGDLEDGGEITISDASSRFGTRSGFTAHSKEWLESQPTLGVRLSQDAGWTVEANRVAGTDATRGKVAYAPGNGAGIGRELGEMVDGTWQYWSYWVRRNTVFKPIEISTQGGQHKLGRWTYGPTFPTWGETLPLFFWTFRNGSANSYYGTRSGSKYVSMGDSVTTALGEGPWFRIESEVLFYRSDNPTLFSVTGRTRREGRSLIESTRAEGYDLDPGDPPFRSIFFQDYFGNGYDAPQCQIWADDFYVSMNTRARIELCDSAVWEEAQAAEIQVPLTWSAESVGAKLNIGGYANLAGKHLFVVTDANEKLYIGSFT